MTTTGSNMAEGLFASNAPFSLRTNDKNIEKKGGEGLTDITERSGVQPKKGPQMTPKSDSYNRQFFPERFMICSFSFPVFFSRSRI